jgi:hypothetical protein
VRPAVGARGLSTDDILTGLGLVIVLALGCELLAVRTRLPARTCSTSSPHTRAAGRVNRPATRRSTSRALHPIWTMRGGADERMLPSTGIRRRTMTTETLEELGPVDLVVIGYPADAPMTGSAAQLLLDQVDNGTIRILDAMFVTKNADGTFSGFDANGIAPGTVGDFHVFDGVSSGLLGNDDVATVAAAVEPGTSAVMILYENRWAAPFISAVHQNGGIFIDNQRVPHQDLIDAAQAS